MEENFYESLQSFLQNNLNIFFIISLYFPGSGNSTRMQMFVWISLFLLLLLFHGMILLVFSSVWALCRGPTAFFFPSVHWAICSVGHPVVTIQSLLCSHLFSPLCTSFMELVPQKMCTRTCPRRGDAFSPADKVFPLSLPLIIFKWGTQTRAVCTVGSFITGAPLISWRA